MPQLIDQNGRVLARGTAESLARIYKHTGGTLLQDAPEPTALPESLSEYSEAPVEGDAETSDEDEPAKPKGRKVRRK